MCVNRYGNYPTSQCGSGCAKSTSAFKCRTDWDCSLAGACAGDGTCACDAWASGADCSYLRFAPMNRSHNLGYVDGTHSSWGGNAVRGTDGTWNLFMAEIACGKKGDARCGLGGWGSYSQVAHAVSQSPAGPFKRVGLVAGPEHHNPTLKVGASYNDHVLHSTCTLLGRYKCVPFV